MSDDVANESSQVTADTTQAQQDIVADVDDILDEISANRQDMPYYVYNRLFDAVDELGVKVEKLQDENTKLRDLCKEWYDYAYDLFDECFGEPRLDEDFTAREDRLLEAGVDIYATR